MHVEGVSVEKMIEDVDYELMLGSKKDKDFGAVILFGMGGMTAELIGDFSHRSAAAQPDACEEADGRDKGVQTYSGLAWETTGRPGGTGKDTCQFLQSGGRLSPR